MKNMINNREQTFAQQYIIDKSIINRNTSNKHLRIVTRYGSKI